jgi:hypothetical protein
MLVRAPSAAAILAIALLGTPAAAISKDQCVDSHTQGQTLRIDGKFAAARAQFGACIDPSCPTIVREDCARRLQDLDRSQPTIIFELAGAPEGVSAVQVTVDGLPLADHLDGIALRVDPGEHTFAFAASGVAPVTRRLEIREGDRDRRERILLGGTSMSTPSPTAVPQRLVLAVPQVVAIPQPSPEAHRWADTRTVLGLTLGGAGVVGLGVGSVFGILTIQSAAQQKTLCGTTATCRNRQNAASDHTAAQTDGTVSDVLFASGGALLAVGAYLFLSASRLGPTSSAAGLLRGWALQPMASPDGAALLLRGEL